MASSRALGADFIADTLRHFENRLEAEVETWLEALIPVFAWPR